MDSLNVLITLHRGYGLGDSVQMSAVLRHVARYRPHWTVTYRNEHNVGRGLVARVLHRDAPLPDDLHYDAEVEILLFDTWAGWYDRPNTRVSSCLHERFGLAWDAVYGRYRVDVPADTARKVAGLLSPLTGTSRRGLCVGNGKRGVVALHYEGDSSGPRKNLTHAQAAAICKAVEETGRAPMLLDWRARSPLPHDGVAYTVGWWPHAARLGGDAEVNCAVIAQCAAFVGIDSGPSKCASATDTPALVVWTGHSPLPFHDPAPNTTHLVPRGYRGLFPEVADPVVLAWFEAHHAVRFYDGDPVAEVRHWLAEVLQ